MDDNERERQKAIVRAYMWLFAMVALSIIFSVYMSRNLNQFGRVYAATEIQERQAPVLREP